MSERHASQPALKKVQIQAMRRTRRSVAFIGQLGEIVTPDDVWQRGQRTKKPGHP